ncbi:MAG: tetratricopeptide repeat protein [Gemmatimonadaceae bacterium]
MPSPFLSSEEYDERAHQLYNEGLYDDALDVLKEGLSLYPSSVELHIGVGYARLAREEYAWARQSFDKALILDPDHEDALAGLGETQLKFGQHEAALATFQRILALGYGDDIDLMLQVGRALFREGLIGSAREFFEVAVRESPDSAEAHACQGYAEHRLGNDDDAIAELEKALRLDDDHTEARIYLANILFDREDTETALYHLDHTSPEDHWDELGIWRLIELKKSYDRLSDGDPRLKPWEERLAELAGEPDPVDDLLAEVESRVAQATDGTVEAKGQLELFGALLADLADRKVGQDEDHHITTTDGREFAGSWEEIVRRMRDSSQSFADRSLEEFMRTEARRVYSERRVHIPTDDAESFIRASANAGLLKIVR